MQMRRGLLTIVVFVVLSMGIGFVYAQNPNPEDPQFTGGLEYVIAFSSFIAAGIFYSSSGWIKKVRRKLAGEKLPLDFKKMGKSVLIGIILGIGAMIFSVYDGEPIAIHNVKEFFIQVGINTATILLVDKWILGRADPNGMDTGDTDDTLTIEDVPEEVPPGKN